MAQQTSDLWKTLARDRATCREYAFDINGVWYGPEAEVDHSVSSSLFDKLGIGNAMGATLTMSLYADEIPRGAVIKRYIRLTNGAKTSEWLPKGVFFTNRRTVEDDLWSIEAYDAMLKADITWTPRPNFTFPCTMEAAVQDIAYSMGVELDERNVYQPYTMGEYPAGEYMRRDALMDIAAAHGGNWYISDAGKLRLVPLISFPAETNYLVTEHGDPVLFGGARILLSTASGSDTSAIGAADGSKFYVGLDVTGFENNGLRPAITSVTLQVDADNVITAGTYTGMDLYALCPWRRRPLLHTARSCRRTWRRIWRPSWPPQEEMTAMLCKWQGHLVRWLCGGVLYGLLEVVWRGHTHWTMMLLAAVLCVPLDLANERFPWVLPLWVQAVLGGLVITAGELLAGLVLNVWLGLGIWDYSGMWGNLWGQICPLYTALWCLLAGPVIVAFDWLDYWLCGGERPRYRMI